MKRILYLTFLLGLLACQSSKDPHNSQNEPTASGKDSVAKTFTDPRDGEVYTTFTQYGLTWLGQNLRFDSLESWAYENIEANVPLFGRLYSWEAALQACPEGWHLPSDAEWRTLSRGVGGYVDIFDDYREVGNPEKGYFALIWGGDSGFNGLHGGVRFPDGSFHEMGKSGFYWTSTSIDEADAHNYVLSGYSQQVLHFNTLIDDKEAGFSCRCIKD